jgi:hypothetical protein
MKLQFTGIGCLDYAHFKSYVYTQLLFQIYVAIHFSDVVASVTGTAQEIVSTSNFNCIMHNLKKYLFNY